MGITTCRAEDWESQPPRAEEGELQHRAKGLGIPTYKAEDWESQPIELRIGNHNL